MSNDGNPNRKFSQTFFLAEQPNGYYVLNDIFRYLKDDDDIEEGDEYDYVDDAAGDASTDVAEGAALELTEERFQDLSVKETASLEIETAQGEVEEPVPVEPTVTTTTAGVPVQEAVNGSAEPLAPGASVQPATIIITTEVAATAAEPETEAEEPTIVSAAAAAAPTAPASTASAASAAPPAAPTTPSPEAEQQSVDQPAAAAAAAVPPAVEEKPTPTSTPTPTPASAPAPAPAPAPVAPPPVMARPKTWANVVTFNAKIATPATQPPPTAAAAPAAAPAAVQAPVPVTAPPPAPATPVTPTSSGGGAQWQMADSKRHSRAMTAGQTQAYVKNVTDAVNEKTLRETLTKYGNLKFFEINRQKVPRFLYPDKTCIHRAHILFFRIVPLWNLKLQRPSALPTVQTRT